MKQAEKLKSREMKEGRMKNDEGWMMKDDDFKLLRGFADRQMNEQMDGWTDICDCRVALQLKRSKLKIMVIYLEGEIKYFSN